MIKHCWHVPGSYQLGGQERKVKVAGSLWEIGSKLNKG